MFNIKRYSMHSSNICYIFFCSQVRHYLLSLDNSNNIKISESFMLFDKNKINNNHINSIHKILHVPILKFILLEKHDVVIHNNVCLTKLTNWISLINLIIENVMLDTFIIYYDYDIRKHIDVSCANYISTKWIFLLKKFIDKLLLMNK